VLYALSAVYFAGVMVRLMLTLTPAVCILSGIAFSKIFENYLKEDGPITSNGTKTVEEKPPTIKTPSKSSQVNTFYCAVISIFLLYLYASLCILNIF